MPSISVIVPVYNTGDSILSRCLDSLLEQTYSDYEIIIIDDGSGPETAHLCDAYAEKNSRIRVFHTENHGLGSARNLGISKALGIWISFVDSDDWCEREYLEAFKPDKYKDADLITQGFIRDDNHSELGRCTVTDEYCRIDRITEFYYRNHLIDFSSACCRLFKKDIIQNNHLRYPTTFSYGEDSAFFPKYLQHCASIVGISEEHYHYMLYPDSMSRSIHDTNLLFDFIQDSTVSIAPLVHRDRFGRLIGIEHNRKSVALSMRAYVNMYLLQYDVAKRLSLMSFFRKEIRPLLNGRYLPFKESVFWIISGLPPKVQLTVFDYLRKWGIINDQ